MYKQDKMVLYSRICGVDTVVSVHNFLPTNGSYVRSDRGHILGRTHSRSRSIAYLGECNSLSFEGWITDGVLCERIREYFTVYRGKKYTNCAAMAHFLTTGKFVECTPGYGMAVVYQGMRPYSMVNKVGVGDMLCIVYGNYKILRSRKFPSLRSRFVASQRDRSDGNDFLTTVSMQERVFLAEEVRELCKSSSDGFHFMTCVGHFRGRPVWISQLGHLLPGSPEVAVVLTAGEYNPYPESSPLFTLIKKRR